MSRDIKIRPVMRETIDGAVAMIAPTFLWFLLYASVASAIGLYQEYGYMFADLSLLAGSSIIWILAGLLVSCAWAVSVYQGLLPGSSKNTVAVDTGKLLVANLLVILVFILVAFMIGLFLVIFSGIMIAASGYDPSGSDAADISGSIAALQASGGIWMIYAISAVGLAILIWFGVRLILYGAATVAQGRVIVFQSWGLTKGATLKIALLTVLFVGVPLALMAVANEATAHVLGLKTLWSEVGISFEESATPVTGGILQSVMAWGLSALYQMPVFLLGHSLAAALYRRLGPETVDAEVTFG